MLLPMDAMSRTGTGDIYASGIDSAKLGDSGQVRKLVWRTFSRGVSNDEGGMVSTPLLESSTDLLLMAERRHFGVRRSLI